jgi:hypothetical protein
MSDTILLEWEDLVLDFIKIGFTRVEARICATAIMEDRYKKFTTLDDVVD